ncbi:MAG: hypothetical protein AB1756_01215 [Acidobacteriota bacterium]
MNKTNEKRIEKRLKSIKRGAYWFGVIGRLSIFFGMLYFIYGTLKIVTTYIPLEDWKGQGLEPLLKSIYTLIYGWLFLFARDAFEAIEQIFKEMEDIV